MYKTIIFFILLISFISFSSCRKTRTFQMQVKNETGYSINQLSFDGTSKGIPTNYGIGISRNETTEIFELEFDMRRTISGDDCLKYWVNYFLDSTGNTYGDTLICEKCLYLKDLDEKQLNSFTLKQTQPDANCGQYAFILE